MKKEMPWKSAPLGAVEVRDEYQQNAFGKMRAYLLSLEEGRLLAGFYENAGKPSAYLRYGGWESGLIGGHTLGHYLSAVAQCCACGGVPRAEKALFQKKLGAILAGLASCQAENGFLWGAPPIAGGAEAQFDNVERGRTNIKREAWVPWYTMHKLLAGLVDCYRLAGEDRALAIASSLGDWVAARSLGWSKRLQAKVLSVEYGGMNDCLYELYALTGKREHLLAAHMFDEEALFDAVLSEKKDGLKGKHANTTIPKLIGALKRYLVLNLRGEAAESDGRYLSAAEAFFRTVTERHTYATGGNSEWEHFGADFALDSRRTNCNCETCNVYNMLKLARLLFCATGKKVYADYYDNAFVNSILSSQNPETGMTTYFQPMAGGFFKVFSRPYDSFWCCTGSGMESLTKLGDGVYYLSEEGVAIARYVSSRLVTDGTELSVSCDFPLSDRAEISVLRAEKPFLLCLRVPDWAAGAPVLTRNGTPVSSDGEFLRVAAREGDLFSLTIPVGMRAETLPDGALTAAFRFGGALLSADLGSENMAETETGVNVTVPVRRAAFSERLHFQDAADVLARPDRYFERQGELFRLRGAEETVVFGLHYRRFRERYAVYFRLGEEAEAAREPLDAVQVGYGQYEADELHALTERRTVAFTSEGTSRYARAGGYFRYDMKIEPAGKNVLSFRLRSRDNGKTLKITVGDTVLFAEYLHHTMGEEVYRREVEIPSETAARCAFPKIVNGEETTVIPVRFEGFAGRVSARVCEFVEIYRTDV